MKRIILKKEYLLNADIVIFLLRVLLGIIFFAHGSQKVFGLFGGYGLEGTAQWMQSQLGIPIIFAYLSSFVELFSGVGLLFGVISRIWGVVLSINLLVAILIVHINSFFAPGGMEYPLTLLIISIVIIITGSGKYSVDKLLEGFK